MDSGWGVGIPREVTPDDLHTDSLELKVRGCFFQKSKATLQKGPLPFPNPGRQGGTERKHSHHCLTERETEAH